MKITQIAARLLLMITLVMLAAPIAVEAKYRGEVGGWVPYWAEDEAVEDLEKRMDEIDILYPFVYEVEGNGDIVAKADLDDDPWEDLLDEARDERVDILPTIAWFDGDAIHATLANSSNRRAFIDDIVDLVDDNDFDGINIDFEQKNAETIDHFSTFLKELEDELGRDDLSCTIEARMPPEHRWRNIPSTINYANDYKAMNKYCDWVEIMAYDQQRADILINDERRGVPYMPVADKEWVETVLEFALEDIDADKIMLGIATYGRAWDVAVAPDWYRDYTKVATLNQPRILELSDKYNSPIGRSEGGEAVISYFPEDSVWKIFDQLPTPEDTPKGFEAAAKALMVATYTGVEIPVRFITWSDGEAAEDKIDLAEEYDLKGVAFFKFDGEEDGSLWKLF